MHIFFLLGVLLTSAWPMHVRAQAQILSVGNGPEVASLDPAKANGSPEFRVISNINVGLTNVDPVTLERVPSLAKSWTISADKLVYTFKLRPGIAWSDGTKIEARDFAWSWERLLRPETGSLVAYQLYVIKNAEALNKGETKDWKKLGVRVTDPMTLEVTLAYPFANFLTMVGFMSYYPVPRHVVERYGERWTRPEHIVSSGPFRVTEWKAHQYIKIERNPFYYDASTVLPDAVVLHAIENINTEENEFLSGKLQMTNSIPKLKIPTYVAKRDKDSSKSPLRMAPQLATYMYKLNTHKKPFDDVRVRRALSLAIDRNSLVKNVLNGGETAAYALTPPLVRDYNVHSSIDRPLPEAIAEAKKLLSEAGYPTGKNFPKVHIKYNTDANHRKVAVALQAMWKQNLGIDVGLINEEWKVFVTTLIKSDFEIAKYGWIGAFFDPEAFLELFVSGRENNNTGWANPIYDKLLVNSRAQESAKRFKTMVKAEELLIDEAPIIPLYYFNTARLADPRLKIRDWKGLDRLWEPNALNSDIYHRLILVN